MTEQKKDGLVPSLVEGTKPFVGCGVGTLKTIANILVTPTLYHVRNSALENWRTKEHYTTDEKVLGGLTAIAFCGWARTWVAGLTAIVTNEPVAIAMTAYYAADTAATSLRRIGWGKLHNAFKNDRN